MVVLGSLHEEDRDQTIKDQIQRMIYSVFSWESGNYKFETIDKPVEDDLACALSTDEIKPANIAARARGFTVPVECWK